jgi:hypothetical protein
MSDFGQSSNLSVAPSRKIRHSFLNPRPLVLQDWLFLALKVVGGIICIYFYFHSPVPGVSIACLAVAAAALSVHQDPNPWQKALWLLLMGGFLWVELHAIRIDRAEANRHAQEDRAEQNVQFQAVRDQQNEAFSATAESLQTAIQGIQSTLKTSNTLVRLSQPQAVMHVQRVEFSPLPTELKPGIEYWFNIQLMNRGLAPAKNTHFESHVYVTNAEDVDAQKLLAAEFEKTWATDHWKSGLSSSGEESFRSANHTMSQEEIEGMRTGKDSIYVLSRVEYSDDQGRWRTDDCEFVQNVKGTFSSTVMHWCGVFKKQRYPAPANYKSLTSPPEQP